MKQFKTLKALLETFPTEQRCIDYLFSLHPYCVNDKCQSDKIWRFKDGKTFKCAACKKRFTMKTGSVMENSKISIQQWFIIYYLNTKLKKGASSYTIAEEAGITQKTSWFRLQAIRSTLDKSQPEQMSEAQADETMVGGKNKNRHYNKRAVKNEDKTIVVGMYDNKTGKVRAEVTGGRETDCLEPFIRKYLPKGSTLITDDHSGYKGMKYRYNHIVLNRSGYEYFRMDGLAPGVPAHNQAIEGFWAHIDRTIMGSYHKVSPKHLQLYVNECTFRYNTRQLSQHERMITALNYRYGKKVTYKEIIQRQAPPKGPKPFFFRPK